MASDAVQIEVGGRSVRVSSPDRVIFEPTEFSAEVTKLQVAQYYAEVSDGILRALKDRPVTLERWPKGVRDGMELSTRQDGKGDAFYQKRRCAAPPTSSSRPGSTSRRVVAPTSCASPRLPQWCGPPTWAP